MTDLRELYQEIILDHNKQPRNFRTPDHPQRQAEGYNPLCGDRVTIYVEVEDGHIRDICFQGAGCAISQASASLMTEAVEGKSLDEAQDLFEGFHTLLTEDGATASEDLGKLAALAGVRDYPMRVKCATLAWHTLNSALKGETATPTTESPGPDAGPSRGRPSGERHGEH